MRRPALPSLLGVSVLLSSLTLTSVTSSSVTSPSWSTPLPTFAPFTAALLEDTFRDHPDDSSPPPDILPLPELRRRQNANCPANYNPCSALAAGSVCCSAGTDCALDQAGQIACCPRGAFCTGTIRVGTVSGTPTTGGFIAGGGAGATSTNSFFVPATTTALTTPTDFISQQGFTGTPNANAYYGGFAALATPFVNEQACTSAYSSCQTEFAKCTSALGGIPNQNLGGGINGVTVSAGGIGGITVAGTSVSVANLGASATSICQSISAQVCQNLQLANCNTLATGVRSVAGAAAAACPTPWPPLYGVGVGVGLLLGVAEQVIVR